MERDEQLTSEQEQSASTNLPALIDRACQRLSQARSSAEVLEAKAIAESALHYAKLTRAANETHADCLRMIVRAEMRMADEIDKKPSTQGKRTDFDRSPDEVPTVEELGISRQRLSEWRDVRDAGEDVVEDAINQALLENRPPTKADIQRAVENRPHVANNSGNNEWYTPPEFIEAARSAMGPIDVDPASSLVANKIVQAKTFYTVADDGLKKTWRGNVWMNPPYAQPLVSQFADAVSSKFEQKEIKRACVLVNNATETSWFQRMLESSSAVCLLKGRVRFLDPSGNPSGAPLQGQAVLYLGENPYRFAKSFNELGVVLMRAE
jgi:phage N-6-adenine-methyltransferase